jgi:hypothetical protein
MMSNAVSLTQPLLSAAPIAPPIRLSRRRPATIPGPAAVSPRAPSLRFRGSGREPVLGLSYQLRLQVVELAARDEVLL